VAGSVGKKGKWEIKENMGSETCENSPFQDKYAANLLF
jgi:hypothetical protein